MSVLTEVVGHHGRGRGGRLGELISPTALLLQVLWDHKKRQTHTGLVFTLKHLINGITAPTPGAVMTCGQKAYIAHLCSYFQD